MSKRNRFDPTEFDPSMKGRTLTTETATPPTTEDDADRAAVDKSLADLQSEREKWEKKFKSIDGWRKKLQAAQGKVATARAKFEEADAARKTAKAAVETAISKELELVAKFVNGEQLLPFSPDEPDEQQPPGGTPAAPVGEDEGAASPITILLAKEIKKVIGADAFAEAKGRGEPVGLTPNAIDVIEGQGWDTIGKLEKAMRENLHWFDSLKGFGESKINQLINTLHAFRRVHPHPEDTSNSEEIPTGPRDWEQSVADLDYVIRKSGELVSEGPSEGIDFAKSVGMEAVEMRKGIEERQSVTDDQLTAIHNWTEGLEKWQPANS